MELNLDVWEYHICRRKLRINRESKLWKWFGLVGRLLFSIVCYFNGFGSNPCFTDVLDLIPKQHFDISKLFYEHSDWMNSILVVCHIFRLMSISYLYIDRPNHVLNFGWIFKKFAEFNYWHNSIGCWRSFRKLKFELSIRYLSLEICLIKTIQMETDFIQALHLRFMSSFRKIFNPQPSRKKKNLHSIFC